MSDNLLDVLTPGPPPDRVYGVVNGVVTNNQDPDNLGRVKVRFPWLSAGDESAWARVAAPMAGKDRGAYFLPEVDDEVLVAFEHGDVRFPYVLGALWNGVDVPPVKDNADGKNNVRVIRSRTGHVVRLDDTDGAGKVEVIDATGKNTIVIDSAKNTLTLTADGDITIESASGKVVLKGASIEVKATSQGVLVEAAGNMDLKAGPQLNVKGSVVNLN